MKFLVNIITPVAGLGSFVAQALKILIVPIKAIFKALLPALVTILEALIVAVKDIVFGILEELLFRAHALLLDIIGYLEMIAGFLMGLNPIKIKIEGESGPVLARSFLAHVFSFSSIDKIFLGMLLIALPLTALITVYKMIPKIDESEEEQPILVAVRKLMLAVLRMLSLGAVCAVLLHGSIALVKGVHSISSISQNDMPDVIFVSTMSGFAKSGSPETVISKYLDPAYTDHTYGNVKQVMKDFENPELVWLVIFMTDVMCIVSFAGLIFAAAKRGLSLVVIYIFGPLCAALSIDNEDIFNRYKRQLFAQFFSYVSSTLSLAVFSVISVKIGQLPGVFSSDRVMNSIMKCLVILLFVMSIDEVADMMVTLLSDVRFNDFANSKGAMAQVAMDVVGSLRRGASEVTKSEQEKKQEKRKERMEGKKDKKKSGSEDTGKEVAKDLQNANKAMVKGVERPVHGPPLVAAAQKTAQISAAAAQSSAYASKAAAKLAVKGAKTATAAAKKVAETSVKAGTKAVDGMKKAGETAANTAEQAGKAATNVASGAVSGPPLQGNMPGGPGALASNSLSMGPSGANSTGPAPSPADANKSLLDNLHKATNKAGNTEEDRDNNVNSALQSQDIDTNTENDADGNDLNADVESPGGFHQVDEANDKEQDNAGPTLENQNANANAEQSNAAEKNETPDNQHQGNLDKNASSLNEQLKESNKADETNDMERDNTGPALEHQNTDANADKSSPSEEDDNALASILTAIATPFVYAYKGISTALSAVSEAITKVADKIKSGLEYVADKIKGSAVGKFVASVATSIGGFFTGLKNGIKTHIIEPSERLWKGFVKKLDAIKTTVTKYKNKAVAIIKWPYRKARNYVKRAGKIAGERLSKILKKKK